MRDNLLGYLIGALEPEEREAVEQSLERDPRLRVELDLLDRSLEPLRRGRPDYDPSPGLVERTCDFVVSQATVMLAPAPTQRLRMGWTMSDFVVAAGIVLAASMFFFPALNHSRHGARLAGCSNNLRQLGVALSDYSQRHGGLFPSIETSGNLSTAGMYAPRLRDAGYISDPSVVICPASPGAGESREWSIPSVDELRSAFGPRLANMQHAMGGDYAFNIGFVSGGRYHTPKNLGRPTYAMLSDLPNYGGPTRVSQKHGGCSQNVLFEDGHVETMRTCIPRGCQDDIFLNSSGLVAPGNNMHDSVVAPSSASPAIQFTLDR